ncbi:hypothetical protein DPMN_146757 [Dreissena polymorpha]|uniref:Uncharacterized protein n=1 Tax=Dreissena polymorpha TaxID=45954 RepID=A0A9D4J004_DREPO|nr:hypothetical protein DPMN_146757 [Dreissena polymorpha]
MADGGIKRDVPGGVPRQGRLSNSYAVFQFELASAETCTSMNVLGYGPHIRQARRDAYKAFDRHATALLRGLAMCNTTGSKAEGLTSYYESDRDIMCVATRAICLEEGVDQKTFLARQAYLDSAVVLVAMDTVDCY